MKYCLATLGLVASEVIQSRQVAHEKKAARKEGILSGNAIRIG